MAKYTELLIEYLQTNELPDIFDEIPDFKAIFTGHYCDYEIGFETERLFKLKLETKAKIVIPEYKKRIAEVDKALAQVLTTTKTRQTTIEAGEQASQSYTLPFNTPNVNPTNKAHNDAFTNVYTYVERGATIDENLRIIDELSRKRDNIIDVLLLEFKPLFMAIY